MINIIFDGYWLFSLFEVIFMVKNIKFFHDTPNLVFKKIKLKGPTLSFKKVNFEQIID